MKKFIFRMLLALGVIAAFSGCKEKDDPQHRIVGEWFFSDEESGQDIEIYISFNLDRTFDLYQKIGEGYPRYLKGTYYVDRNLLSGEYFDGTPWASDYELTFVNGDMMMKAVSTDYTVTYKKQRIPDEVRNFYVDLTKAGVEDFVPFL